MKSVLADLLYKLLSPVQRPIRVDESVEPRIPGNIDLYNRPAVQNPDNSFSTVRSMSFGSNLGETLVPTVSPWGTIFTPEEAIGEYEKTGKHLGVFSSPEEATTYAKGLHNRYETGYYSGFGNKLSDFLRLLMR